MGAREPSRRFFLGGLAALVHAGAGSGAIAAAGAEVAPQAWANAVATHIRIRSNRNGERTFFFISGDIWARRPDRVAERLFIVEACSFNRLTRLDNGKLEHVNSEIGSFKDPLTGAYLDQWTNPYNGQSCEVPLIGGGGRVGRVILTPSGVPEGLASAIQGSFMLGEPVSRGGTIWVSEDTAVLIPRPVPGRPGDPPAFKMVSTSGLTTFAAAAADVENEVLDFVPATLSFVEVSEWWPWMKMGDAPGFMTWRLYGSKLRRPEDLPEPFIGFVKRHRPDWLANPGV